MAISDTMKAWDKSAIRVWVVTSILSGVGLAQTTTNLNLVLPPHGALNWDVFINGNSSIIDAVFNVGTCGDGSHALGYNSTTKMFTCQLLVSTITGGTCTNQAVTAINTSGVPTCTTITSAYVNNTIALTGVDISTASQLTVTHLAAALPVNQGGTGAATITGGLKGNGTAALTAPASTDIIVPFTCGSGTQL